MVVLVTAGVVVVVGVVVDVVGDDAERDDERC
jgi:hypothetical protein